MGKYLLPPEGQFSQTHLKKQSQAEGLSKMYLILATHQKLLAFHNFQMC